MSKIKELPIDEQPYEKCFKYGPSVLTDAELLGTILRTGTKGISAYEMANMIYNSSLQESGILSLMHLSKQELLKLKGIGKVKCVQILCISELAKRIFKTKAKRQLQMNNPSTIANYYMEEMRHLKREELKVLFLDTKCQLIKDMTMTIGTVNKSLISNREIIVEALKCDAVNIIVMHNHPSGDPTPSSADLDSTHKLNVACKLVEIKLVDHIIIGDQKHISFVESNIKF